MNPSAPTQETVVTISDLCCSTEELLIRKKLESLAGIQQLQFNLISHRLIVRHSVKEKKILDALKDIGLPGYVENKKNDVIEKKTSNNQAIAFLVSATFLEIGGIFSWTGVASPLPQILYSLAILYGGWLIALKGFRSLKNHWLDINVLMTVAVIGAVVIGHFGEGAAVVVLYSFSLLLESKSVDRTRQAIHSLMKLSPSTATAKRNGTLESVPVERVSVGETILIKPGERIPMDGRVISGVSTVDQSPITGEAVPVLKHMADPVFAGSFNQRGAFEIEVTKPAADSTLARIIHLVEEAQTQRAQRQTLIERFAKYYTPSVFAFSILIAVIPTLILHQQFSDWFYRALVVLVIACPCALVISTPLTIASALTNAARRGVLIKGGIFLEQLAGVDAIAFDKTGTLTEGRLTVVDVIPMNSLSEQEIVKLAAAVELHSEHHLAEAFLNHAEKEGIGIKDVAVEHFESLPGKGVRAKINGTYFSLGNHQFAEELNVCSPRVEKVLAAIESKGQTAVIISNEREVLGVISVVDKVRMESKAALGQLHELGVRETMLLTGDNEATARQVGKELGFDTVKSELLPEQKLSAVRELKTRHTTVCMIGDGVNDAPALALADIGVAMGGIGSDSTLETADVVLMADDLSKMPFTVRLGKKALAVIRQNISLSITTKLVFLGLGAFGITSLWLAILADDGVALAVVLNGLRLLRQTK